MTRVVNVYKDKYDVYIGRAGKGKDGYFGNPYILINESERDEVILKYKLYFIARMSKNNEFAERIRALKDKTLGCFCAPKACHGHVIAEYLNQLP